MKYQSTRGGSHGLSFQEAIFKGYAPDGGMFMPEEIPKLSAETLSSWADLSYIDIVKQVAKLYIEEEIPATRIGELINAAFQSFEDPSTPIVTRSLNCDITCMEMFHGKTLTFKDLSMSCTAQFLNYFLQDTKTHAILLNVTSGDTGSSALQAVASVDYVDAVVLYPKDRISPIQELQMITATADNCHVGRVDATPDDMDIIVKKLYSQYPELVERCQIGTLNSVNWCREMVQIAHHFYSYYQGTQRSAEKESAVFIPTGGLGNATSATIARYMGLPLKIVCAVTNDALYRAVYENDYSVGELAVSLAPAMNMQTPYNWERIVYVVSGKDTSTIKQSLDEYENEGKTTTDSGVITKLRSFLEVYKVSDNEILDTIKRCHAENNGYTICPHTATGLAAAYRYESANKYNLVVLGVASPAKFNEAILKAGVEWKGRDLAEELKDKPTRYFDITASDDGCEKLKELILSIEKQNLTTSANQK